MSLYGRLIPNERREKRPGDRSIGAARQCLIRLGKVDRGLVGIALSCYQADPWMKVDTGLRLLEVWLNADHAHRHRRRHILVERSFTTKLELRMAAVRRARAKELPLVMMDCNAVSRQ